MLKTKRIPLRKCVACSKMLSKKEMVRVVRTTEGIVEIDLTGKKNGRGAYICGKLEGLEKAKKSKAFDRALKVTLTAEDYQRLQSEFETIHPKYAAVECGLTHHES